MYVPAYSVTVVVWDLTVELHRYSSDIYDWKRNIKKRSVYLPIFFGITELYESVSEIVLPIDHSETWVKKITFNVDNGWMWLRRNIHAHHAKPSGIQYQWRIQDFREEGAPTPGGGANIWFCQNFLKLHEIERIWTGGGRPKFYYVDPPLNT